MEKVTFVPTVLKVAYRAFPRRSSSSSMKSMSVSVTAWLEMIDHYQYHHHHHYNHHPHLVGDDGSEEVGILAHGLVAYHHGAGSHHAALK